MVSLSLLSVKSPFDKFSPGVLKREFVKWSDLQVIDDSQASKRRVKIK